MTAPSGSTTAATGRRLAWLDPLKAFALLGILLNHVVEEFGPGPWFTNPANDWPDFATRLRTVFPDDANPVLAVLRFLGWLGDSGPGVFILVSGAGLAFGAALRPSADLRPGEFYRRRMLRLFPLYVTIHLVVMALALFVPGSTDTVAGPRGLLSLLGLRFTPDLFFSVSPSWWFIWLVLQLYLVFPFLYRLLNRLGVFWFLTLALAFTVASRGYGILFSGQRYFWMTGLFFGTRLAEFAAGMAIGAILARRDAETPSGSRLLVLGVPLYLGGFAASLTLPGTLISNFLVTLGLCAIGYAAWRVIQGRTLTARAVLWLGALSYPVFLLHQPPLMWTSAVFPGNTMAHLMAAAAALVLVFPAAWSIERGVDRLLRMPASEREALLLRSLGIGAALAMLAALLVIEPALVFGSRRHRAFAVALSGCVLLLSLIEARRADLRTGALLLRRTALVAGALTAWIIAPGAGDFVVLVVAVVVLSQAALARRFSLPRAGLAALVVGVGAAGAVELLVRRSAPIEAGQWGELPALESHDTRVYGLRPSRETRLRYNDYDYLLRTNSYGLASPEIAAQRSSADALRVLVLGDAFSMPEGVPYQHAWPALLEASLGSCLAPRQVQVINGGVTGYGPNESAAQLRELAPQFLPDVVVYQFFVNEFWDVGVTPDERRLDIGLRGRPRREGLDLGRLQLVAWLRRLRAPIERRLLGGPDPDYARSLAAFYRAGDNEIYSEARRQAVANALGDIRRVAASVGSRLLVVLVPAAIAVERPADVGYYPDGLDLRDSAYDLQRPIRELRAIAEPLGIPAVDLAPALRAHPEHPLYFRTAWHWNDAGHRVAAKSIAESLAGGGYLGAAGRPARCSAPVARP